MATRDFLFWFSFIGGLAMMFTMTYLALYHAPYYTAPKSNVSTLVGFGMGIGFVYYAYARLDHISTIENLDELHDKLDGLRKSLDKLRKDFRELKKDSDDFKSNK